MKPDGTGAYDTPIADFLRGQVERISRQFQAATGSPGSIPERAALQRFLRALDDLSSATQALAAGKPSTASGPSAVLVAGEGAFADEIRRAAGDQYEVIEVPEDDAALKAALDAPPALIAGLGVTGAAAIRRVHELRPGVPAILAATEPEVSALVESFDAEPVVVLRSQAGKELALAVRALLASSVDRGPAPDAATEPPWGESEPRSYAHLAGMLPRALERTVSFDVGVAVIARPGADPLVDVYAAAECPDATRELVRQQAVALFHLLSGGARVPGETSVADANLPIRSCMYFPLATEGGIVGLTYLASFRPQAFSREDELVLASLAKHASGAYRRLEASVHRLRLSPRQSQVLALIASGLSDKEVAARLGLAHRTVRTHVDRMLREHGLRSRTEAVAAWLRGQQG